MSPSLDEVAVTYQVGPDETAPSVINTVPADGATGVDRAGAITIDFSEPVVPGSVSASLSGAGVTASFANGNRRLVLTPTATLAPYTLYTVTIAAGVRDEAGNATSAPSTFSFTTAPASLTETTTADFADGTFSGTAPAAVGNGAVTLGTQTGAILFSDDFSGAAAGWTPLDGTWSVASGEYVYTKSPSTSNYLASMITSRSSNNFSIESRQKATGDPGLLGYVWGIQPASPTNGAWKNSSYMLQWYGSNLNMYRWTNGELTQLGGAAVGGHAVGTWYTLRLEVRGTTFEVFLNGTSRFSATDSTYGAGGIGLVGYETGASHYDDVVVRSLGSSYLGSGTYTSSILDAGGRVHWLTLDSIGTTPASTAISFETRSGETASPDGELVTLARRLDDPDSRRPLPPVPGDPEHRQSHGGAGSRIRHSHVRSPRQPRPRRDRPVGHHRRGHAERDHPHRESTPTATASPTRSSAGLPMAASRAPRRT